MAVFECTSRVTRRSLMNRSKADLVDRILELMDEVGRVRDRLERLEADRRDESLRRIGQVGYEAAAAERFLELRAAAKAALGEIPCGPEWLERLRSAVAGARVKDTVSAVISSTSPPGPRFSNQILFTSQGCSDFQQLHKPMRVFPKRE